MPQVQYSTQSRIPEVLQIEAAQTTLFPVYLNGIFVVPTAVTYSLFNPNGEAIVDGAVGSVSMAGIAQYAHPSSDFPKTSTLGEGWLQQWELTIDGSIVPFRRSASLALAYLYPVIADDDIDGLYPTITQRRKKGVTSWQSYIDAAWFEIIQKFRQGGTLEYLIIDGESLRSVHLNLTLAKIFRSFHAMTGSNAGNWVDNAIYHENQFTSEWKLLNYRYDTSHSGSADNANRRTAQEPVIFLNGGRRY